MHSQKNLISNGTKEISINRDNISEGDIVNEINVVSSNTRISSRYTLIGTIVIKEWNL